MSTVDKWVKIYSDLRVWSSAKEVHKMGWLRSGDRVHLTEQYKTWFRFDDVAGGMDVNPLDTLYTEYWVKGDELEVAAISPTPDPVPEPDTNPIPEPEPEPDVQSEDAELGAAFRVVFDFIFRHFHGWA